MSDKKYANCNIAGDGMLNVGDSKRAIKFRIIEMSAASISIETAAELLEGDAVKLQIRLNAGVVDAYINLKGKVAKAAESGFNIELVDLSEEMREEIDEMMRNSCGLNEE